MRNRGGSVLSALRRTSYVRVAPGTSSVRVSGSVFVTVTWSLLVDSVVND
jgi:hypothetical protein